MSSNIAIIIVLVFIINTLCPATWRLSSPSSSLSIHCVQQHGDYHRPRLHYQYTVSSNMEIIIVLVFIINTLCPATWRLSSPSSLLSTHCVQQHGDYCHRHLHYQYMVSSNMEIIIVIVFIINTLCPATWRLSSSSSLSIYCV